VVPAPSVLTASKSRRRSGVVKPQIVEAARQLFAQRGVSATSLQTIADAIGVTKAAVYHHFKTKEEIIFAVAEEPLRRLEAAVDAAEAEDRTGDSLYVLLVQLVDLAVEQRAIVNTLSGDPVMAQFVAANAPFRKLMRRMYRLLIGEAVGVRGRVRAATVLAALNGTATHALVADVSDRALREQLLECVTEILGVSVPDGSRNTKASAHRGQQATRYSQPRNSGGGMR
jgi:AcrR family transcriptional regulator